MEPRRAARRLRNADILDRIVTVGTAAADRETRADRTGEGFGRSIASPRGAVSW
jgi:hypothetical protein